jgi:N-acetylglucosaminyl-diphospho-decaprenol L-rhamnosyltransferase
MPFCRTSVLSRERRARTGTVIQQQRQLSWEIGSPDVQGEPLVTVAIVSWNTRELLARCLDSLQAEARSGRADVWVVDNASRDGSAAMVRERFPWVSLLALEENVGFGAAVNLVGARTHAPWFVIANADVAFEPAALDALLAAGEADPEAGAIAPRLVLPDGQTQHSVFAFPSLALAAVVATGLGRVLPPLRQRFLLPGTLEPRARVVPWAVAALLLVRRDVWDTVGGFDARQFMYAEDLDICWRLTRAGRHVRWAPDAVVLHESSAATTQAWGGDMTARWQRATYAWMHRRLGPRRTRAFAAVALGGAAARWLTLAAAARFAPGRYAERRNTSYGWVALHREGLGARDFLEQHR